VNCAVWNVSSCHSRCVRVTCWRDMNRVVRCNQNGLSVTSLGALAVKRGRGSLGGQAVFLTRSIVVVVVVSRDSVSCFPCRSVRPCVCVVITQAPASTLPTERERERERERVCTVSTGTIAGMLQCRVFFVVPARHSRVLCVDDRCVGQPLDKQACCETVNLDDRAKAWQYDAYNSRLHLQLSRQLSHHTARQILYVHVVLLCASQQILHFAKSLVRLCSSNSPVQI